MTNRCVLSAPDYRAGIPYQQFLADALKPYGFNVVFPNGSRRGLPLYRGTCDAAPSLLHLHWPESYFRASGDGLDRLRVARYPFDCWLTLRRFPMVLTAHNLLPHNRWEEPGVFRNVRYTARRAKAVFVHSPAAREQMCTTFGVQPENCHIIPYGDHAIAMGRPIARDEARDKLGLPQNEKICLVFGTVSPYKGSDEIVRYWAKSHTPHRLVIIGPVLFDGFAEALRGLADASARIDLRISKEWLDDTALACWLSAVDCAIFNYKQIFTSGAAALARSFGVPLLIPKRLTAADLDEPHPHVLRFDALDTDFGSQLEKALATPPDYELAQDWREKTSWQQVAEITARVYRELLGEPAQ